MPTHSDLLQHYHNLSSFEQTILQFLSVVYEPAHTTLIVNCLRKLGIKSPRGNKPSTANLNHYIKKFQELGLVSNDQQCTHELTEILTKISIKNDNFTPFIDVIRTEAPVSYYYGKWTTRCWRAAREMRIGIYTQNFDIIDESAKFISNQCAEIISGEPPTVQITCSPFDPEWFHGLPPSFQLYLLDDVCRYSQSSLQSYPEVISFLADKSIFSSLSSDERIPFIRLLFNQFLCQGELKKAEELLATYQQSFVGTGGAGALAFLSGRPEEALELYNKDIQILQDITGTETINFFGPISLFYILTLLQSDAEDRYHQVLSTISSSLTRLSGTIEEQSYKFLAAMASAQLNKGLSVDSITIEPDTDPNSWTVLFAGLCQYWLNSSLQPEVENHLVALHKKAKSNGFPLFIVTSAEILARISHNNQGYLKSIDQVAQQQKICSFLSVHQADEPWKRGLQALIQAANPERENGSQEPVRLAWMVTFNRGRVTINPREQKLSPDERWSKGRPVSLSRLYGSSKLSYLTLQDRKICSTIYKVQNPETLGITYGFEMEKTLKEMVGHPVLFLSDSAMVPVEFVAGEPELLVEERGEQLHIRFAQPISDANVSVFHETPTRFKIITIDDNHRRIAQITGKDGLTVPIDASEQVLTAIGNISSFMTVHSAIAADIHTEQGRKINFVEADSTIYMHLLPYGTGFRLEMFVKPFKEGGHYLKPGQGVENLMAEVQGKRLTTKRNLPLEEKKAREIEELCPILDLAIDLEQENEREWHLQDPDDCLQALLELQAIREKVIVEWPEGEKLTIAHQPSLKNLSLKIRTNQQNWFGLSGSLQLDQDRVIDLKELLAKLDKTSGRFVEIEDGLYIALTQEFKKRLEDITTYSSDSDEDDEILIHPLAATPLTELTSQADTDADSGWKEQISKIRNSHQYQPELPSTLQAQLREYQVEGFDWLAKLCRWGVGGCLADDMGLGKTLQSLAIILLHSSKGPSLVVAPTSVTTNWHSETNRFAPTLNIKSLHTKDRKKTISELGQFDLLTTTYTLLQQESELLSSVNWQTIILDEAQAIKNSATKRSQAAMALNGRFRLITTGTPIENHLGELWNLFNFINPGLLGSLSHFNKHFAIPIERFQDREARLKLKKLIRPFILRRIKSEVLDELPPRTEVTLQVEMSEEETHFYEALRQNALDILESNKEKKGRHLQILTEIMKLRQACCNPRLITQDTSIESSKLKVFASVVEELIGGRHKALIFSQFIGHLKILREYLDEKSIHYQYLDGTTSHKNRKERVERFQAGEGDLFLISLKAGGLGLNLTAADYVLHMDPWWNPAIEDQASDRVHRIGQTRPVTIYRLVCKNSIEEKIVQLHQDKRDLAGSLLEGSDMSAKMKAEDLLDLIREK